jgi:tetratricopeptide (TPR) repeat protein
LADSPRIEDLRRRVQKDPASIAFAQLAEELRRAGHHAEAVDVCQAGLVIHPGYLSAHVTLGRALIELNRLEEAATELELVLKSAPDNLAAMRGLGDIYQRRGDLGGALAQYRSALSIARNDPDLEETVADLARKVEPKPRDTGADSLSFEDIQHEFLKHAPPVPAEQPAVHAEQRAVPAEQPAVPQPPTAEPASPERAHALRTVAALEQLLEATHVVRPDPSA